jgi:hypothetical protein
LGLAWSRDLQSERKCTNSNITEDLGDAFSTLLINNNSDNNSKDNEPNNFLALFFFILVNTLLINSIPSFILITPFIIDIINNLLN